MRNSLSQSIEHREIGGRQASHWRNQETAEDLLFWSFCYSIRWEELIFTIQSLDSYALVRDEEITVVGSNHQMLATTTISLPSKPGVDKYISR